MFATSLVLAVGLSMDSFAAALGRGVALDRPGLGEAVRVGAAFGLCQLATPLLGWSVGMLFAELVQAVDHWIAFVLLLGIGGAMVRRVVMADAEDGPGPAPVTGALALFTTAIATSVDAAAVGIGLGVVNTGIVTTALLIGLVTFVMASGGVLLGRAVGRLMGRWAELGGGLLLIGIGAKILVEHTLL